MEPLHISLLQSKVTWVASTGPLKKREAASMNFSADSVVK